jgi:hypothetical protein
MAHATEMFDLVVRSTIVRSDKPTKGLDAQAAPNENQMHRLTGFLPDGRKVVIAQRHGKGGMDFNKLLGGKVYAVAADGFSPVYEKDQDRRPTKVQKSEGGLPLFSASGFYLLSSKEYPSLGMFEAYTLLLERGAKVALITEEQLKARQVFEVASELDLDLLDSVLEDVLGDDHNLVAQYDDTINKKRMRGIERAKQEAEDSDDTYSGVAFKDLAVSKKDGNPLVLYSFRTAAGVHQGLIRREAELVDQDSGHINVHYFPAAGAVLEFKRSAAYRALAKAVAAGEAIEFAYTCGHSMRTSVSFRRKAENILSAEPGKPVFGDGVYVLGALEQWTRGIVSVMHSMHPNFPGADYDAHHYVVACRQAEIGMNKKPEGKGWTAPKALQYELTNCLLPVDAALRKAA